MIGELVGGTAGWALLILGFLFLPGMALSLAVFGPERLSAVTRLAVALPLGYASVAVTAFVLALLHALTAPLLLVSWGVVTVGLVTAAWYRSGLRRQPDAVRRGVREEPVELGLALAVIVAFFFGTLLVDGVTILGHYTPLRYWADGLEVAAEGGIPALSMQWGQMLPAATSKVGLNVFDGALSLLVGRDPFDSMDVLVVVAAVAVAMSALALARELGMRLSAALFPLVLFANHLIGSGELTRDARIYRAETWGRVAAFTAAAMAVRSLRAPPGERRLPEALIAGGLFGVGMVTHLVPTAVLAAFVLVYGLVVAVQRRRLSPAFRAGIAVTGVAVVLGGGMLVLAPGDPGFRGVNDPRVYADMAVRLGLPPGFDPTLYLAKGELAQVPREHSGAFYESPAAIADRFSEIVVGARKGHGPPGWAVALMGAAMLAGVVWLGPRELRVAAIATILLAAGLLALALVFAYRYDLFALALFGERRLFDYGPFCAWVLAVALVEAVLVRLGRVRAKASHVVAVALFVMTAGVLVPHAVRDTGREDRLATLLPVLEWIEDNVACGGRVLVDRRTLGTFEATVGRVGVLEGMGPYFRPDVLEVALGEILEAGDFFRDPVEEESYLRENHVAVVVVTAPGIQLLGGAHRLAGVDAEELARAPFLEPAVETETATVFRVTTFEGGPLPPGNTPFCPRPSDRAE